MEAPERIYLQVEPEIMNWGEGVTWCVDCINDTDVEYVRRDVAVNLRTALERCMADGTGWNYAVEINGRLAIDETAWLAQKVHEEER